MNKLSQERIEQMISTVVGIFETHRSVCDSCFRVQRSTSLAALLHRNRVSWSCSFQPLPRRRQAISTLCVPGSDTLQLAAATRTALTRLVKLQLASCSRIHLFRISDCWTVLGEITRTPTLLTWSTANISSQPDSDHIPFIGISRTPFTSRSS
jgi:hypothetical protein